MRRRIVWLLAAVVIGCGGGSDGTVPVRGTVTLDGKPLAGALVAFTPATGTDTFGGAGTTDAAGRYAVAGRNGATGLAKGTYTVTVSRRLRKDGTPPPPGVPPAESDATETLPAKYSNSGTALQQTVDADRPYDLSLDSRKK